MQIMASRREIKMQSDIVHIDWLNSNPDVEIVATDATPEYFSYSMGSNNLNYRKIGRDSFTNTNNL